MPLVRAREGQGLAVASGDFRIGGAESSVEAALPDGVWRI